MVAAATPTAAARPLGAELDELDRRTSLPWTGRLSPTTWIVALVAPGIAFVSGVLNTTARPSLPSERVFIGAIAAALIAVATWYVMSQRAPVHRRAPLLRREFFKSIQRSLDDDHATLAAAALLACVLFLAVCASPAAQALTGPFTLEAYRAAPDSHRYVELQLLDGLHLTRTPPTMTKDILFRDVPLLSLAAAVREFAAEEPLPLTAEEPTRFTVLLRADRLGDASTLRARAKGRRDWYCCDRPAPAAASAA